MDSHRNGPATKDTGNAGIYEPENIKVSVLIYVRNDKSHIETCIRSVMNQTLRNIEIIIIDGDSSDGTLEIIKEMSALDSRIKICHSAPSVGLQFNTGLKLAKGEYIGICESDDYVLPDMYERQYETAHQNRLDILKADFYRFGGCGEEEIRLPFTVLGDVSLYERVICPRENGYLTKMGIKAFWSGIYRRDFLLKHNIFMNETQGAAYQDTSFSFMTLLRAERMMVSREAFYCYRWDNPNSSVNSPQKITMILEEYTMLKERLLEEGVFEKWKEFYFSWKVDSFIWFYDRISECRRPDYVERIYQELKDDISSGKFRESELALNEAEALFMVRQSKDAFEQYLEEKALSRWKIKERLEQVRYRKNVVIFGNGNVGKLVHQYVTKTGGSVLAYVDNRKEIWGMKDGGTMIISPEQSAEQFYDATYIVANSTHYEEMKRQLLGLSIREEQIIVCPEYEFLLDQAIFSTS